MLNLNKLKIFIQGYPISSVNVFGLLIVIVTLVLTINNPRLLNASFSNITYYIILTLVVCWVWSLIDLWRNQRISPLLFIKDHWRGFMLSFLLTTLVFVCVPKSYRVLSDETNLLSISKSMTFNKNIENVIEGRWYYEMFWPSVTSKIEKRPYLFPFFTSIFHTILGYNPHNVFILNFFVLWAVLFLLYLLIKSKLGDLLAFSSIILVISQPIIPLSATSGSFEVFNLLFILASFVSLRYFLQNPHYKSFAVLILTLVMLANIRYESIIFFSIIVIVLLLTKNIRLKFFNESSIFAIIPIFFLPWIWQRFLMLNAPDINLPEGSWIKAFNLASLFKNSIQFLTKDAINLNGQLGYSGIINIFGIIALIYLSVMLFLKLKRTLESQERIFTIVLFTCIFVLFIVVNLYQYDFHTMNGRLYIPFLVVLSILPIYFLIRIFPKSNKLKIFIFLGSFVVFILYFPVAIEDRLTANLISYREFKFVSEFVSKNTDGHALIISSRPNHIVVLNRGGISFSTANNEAGSILSQFHNHLYNSIYVVQSISYQTGLPLKNDALKDDYQLETITELEINNEYFFRISKVKQ